MDGDPRLLRYKSVDRAGVAGIALLTALLVLNAAMPSPEPAPRVGTAPAGQQSQLGGAAERGSEQLPYFVKILPAPRGGPDTAGKGTEADDHAAEWQLVRVTWVLAGIGLIQFFMLLGHLGVFGWQGFQLKRTVTGVKLSERAYVQMSHAAPGLIFSAAVERAFVKVEVKNFGHTPAEVTDVVLKLDALPGAQLLPDKPNYEREGPRARVRGFIVYGGHFFHDESFPTRTDVDYRTGLRLGVERLWLYGYVDYIDQFGQRRRAGYARVYNATLDDRANYGSDADFANRSNLSFVPLPLYNYDRPRVHGEGNDWHEIRGKRRSVAAMARRLIASDAH